MYIILKRDQVDLSKVNNTNNCGGRFGNIFIRTFVAEYIAKKNNLKMEYEKNDMFLRLGIKLFNGENIYNETLVITDDNIDNIIFNDNIFNQYAMHRNILFKQTNYNPLNFIDYCWCQTSSIVSHIRNVVNYENRVFDTNPYKDRYGNNNDLFIHVRLGDIVDLNFLVDYSYYDSIISKIYESDNYKNSPYFNNGISYITSDSINHEICQRLIQKYNLIPYNKDEIDTLQFGSTCQNIVLSNGTFSWLLGLLSFKSNVHYPNIKIKWHGNIFIYPDWHKVGW